MVFQIDFKTGKPVYLQLVDQIRYAAASGAVRPGEPLPSIRPLAEELVSTATPRPRPTTPNWRQRRYQLFQAGLLLKRKSFAVHQGSTINCSSGGG
jgi:DNA-binding transcriptional MocR family regulator